MSGHSKWATIRRKKASQDAKRGSLFTRLIREITVAARLGGDDMSANPRLRTAVIKAKENNMPNDNIERAIKKGTGTLDGITYEEIRYEGYGPGGVALMIDCLTDNRKRTTPEIRTILNKNNGSLGENGCVAYNFARNGMIIIEEGQVTEDKIMELLIESDIDDIKTEDGNIIVTTSAEGYNDVYDLLLKKEYTLIFHEITYIPKSTIMLDKKKAMQCLKLIGLIEEQDDVQNVYSNYDIPDDILQKISEAQ